MHLFNRKRVSTGATEAEKAPQLKEEEGAAEAAEAARLEAENAAASELAAKRKTMRTTSFGRQLDDEQVRLVDQVEQATSNKLVLESTLSSGERRQAEAKKALAEKLEGLAKATEQIKGHKTGLEDLMKALEREAAAARSKAGEQERAASRLKEEHAVSAAASAKARLQAEEARRLQAEAVAAGHADTSAADDNTCRVEAAAAKAGETLAANRAVAQSLKDRLAMLSGRATTAMRELEFHKKAAETLVKDSDLAKQAAQKSRNAWYLAASALASHKRDAARRLRARDAEVARTRGRAATANKLRDLRMRGQLGAEDRDSFAPCGDAAHTASLAVADAVSRAVAGRDSTRAADSEKFSELVTAANKAATSFDQRERVAASVAERRSVREASALEARKASAAADAAVEAAKDELVLLEVRADGPLTQAAGEAEARAVIARAAAADVRTRAADEQMPLRHNAEAEEVVVFKQEEAEAKLADALAVAQLDSAEAEASAGAALDEQSEVAAAAEQVAAASGPAQSDLLVVAEARTRLEQREHDVVQARATKDSCENTLAEARVELAEEQAKLKEEAPQVEAPYVDAAAEGSEVESPKMGRRRSSASSRSPGAGRLAALMVAVEQRESSLQDASAELSAAEAAALAVKAEIRALEAAAAAGEEAAQAAKAAQGSAQRGSLVPAKTVWATASLVREERALADARIASHKEQEEILNSFFLTSEAKWKEEMEVIKGDLHRATMNLQQVTEDMKHKEALQQITADDDA